ncbi:TonB-dependent receptor [Lysobacteraceae bacterium NML95-0200]|nr:TonB-dependent receptor [Xanthomonadaceae bacterium NML95-0200]
MSARSIPAKKLLCTALLSALALPAAAQSQNNNAELDRVTVTGSRIKRTEVEAALPITTLKKDEIERQGISSTEQLMMFLNIAGNGSDNLASNGGITSEEQRGNNGVSGANLRGQGADATLVLLNGRRVATHGLKGRAVDLNSIPFAAIERVEVLRDGASAIYGTDAIGGVINFITKDDYQGAQLSADADVTEAGGGHSFRYSLLAGHGDLDENGWNVFASLSLRRSTILRGADRDFSNTFQPERGLSPDTRGTPFATVFNREGSLLGTAGVIDPRDGSRQSAVNVLRLPGGAGCANGGEMMGDYDYLLWRQPASRYACAWDYPAAAVIQQPVESRDFLGRASFKIADNHQASIELTGSRVDVTKTFEPNQISPGRTFDISTWYPASGIAYERIYQQLAAYFGAAQLDYGAPIAYRWRCYSCGPRQIQTVTDSWRALLAFNGTLGEAWDYDIGLSRASSQSTSTIRSGYHYTDALKAALGSGHVNPFLLPGQAQTAEGQALMDAASAAGVELYSGTSTVTQLDASLSGELPWSLPGGAIAMATGIDLRREQYRFKGDTRVAGQPIFNAPFDDANALEGATRNVRAAYLEFYLPVLSTLEFTLAGRYDRYDGFGSTTNPKYSFKYRPADWLAFRGAYSTGFKVPSFNQLFNGVSETLYTGLDLADPARCPGGVADASKPGCESIRPDQLFGGRVDLQPEESRQRSLGVVLAPHQNFNMSLDWWEIERSNTIRNAPLEVLVDYYDVFSANWIRDAAGNITHIDRRYINSGGSRMRGIELDANLTGELAGGAWRVNLNGSYLSEFRTKALETLPYSDNLVGEYVRYYNLPLRWKHTLGFSWARGNWAHSLTQVYRSGYKDELPISVRNGTHTPREWNPDVRDYALYNYSLTYTGFERFKLGFGIKNLFDAAPPFTAHMNDFAAGAGWEPRVADPRGRAYVFKLEYTLW